MNIHRNMMLASVAVSSVRLVAFDPAKNAWKKTADGTGIEMKDGNPVWIDANGGEMVMQQDAITRLNSEAKTLRTAKEQAETKLAAFGNLDPVAAAKAVETVGKLDAKKLIDAGEVDRLTDQIKQQFTGQLTEAQKTIESLKATNTNMQIDGVFSGSEFVRNKLAVPLDMFQATFRNNFKVGDDGKITAVDKSGNQVYSEKNIGQLADPNEALEILVKQHPQKDIIMKANPASGSGNNGISGANNGARVIMRADFDKMDPMAQAANAKLAGEGKVVIQDPT